LGTGAKIGIGVGISVATIAVILIIPSVLDTMMIQQEEEEIRNEAIEKEQEIRNLSIGELKELSVSWYYDNLLRNPEKYKGEIIFFRGEIFMVDSIGKDHYVFFVIE